MELFTVDTGFFKLDGGAMFGVVPKSIWSRTNPSDENNLCPWAMRCLLVSDGNRLVLIDTGIGDKQDARFFSHYYLHGDASLTKSLQQLGVHPTDITDVFLTHLHFDHCGCNCNVCNACIIVQQPEWDWATQAEPQGGYIKTDYDTGQEIKTINGEYDIFGDGSVVCFPSYGHTPGHQSLRVETEKGQYVLTGDACYVKRTLDEMALPGVMHNREQTIKSLEVFRQMQANGATIIYGHDPDFWPTLNKAPNNLA